jgi:hypothetical protein
MKYLFLQSNTSEESAHIGSQFSDVTDSPGMSALDLDLLFQGKVYAVPRECVFELISHHRDLMDPKSYGVRSSVPVSVFEAFIGSLKSQTKPNVTRESAASLLLLAKEFFLPDLASECAALAVDPLSLLSARVSKLEERISSLGPAEVEAVRSQANLSAKPKSKVEIPSPNPVSLEERRTS